MELSKILKFIAKEHGIMEIDFLSDVMLVDEGNGVEIREWNLPFDQPTTEEILSVEDNANAYQLSLDNEIKIENKRSERDQLLSKSDWRLLREYEPKSDLAQEWKTYRQALRDLPDQPGFPDVDMPTEPTE